MSFLKSKLFKKYIESDPIVLADVGARGGIHRRWRVVRDSLKVFGFEPDEEECKKLNSQSKGNAVFFPIALYCKKGTININITRYRPSSSIYLPNRSLTERFPGCENAEIINSVEVKCDTFDGIVKKNNIQNIDFLKIDTEGAELEVLRGSKKSLKNFIFGVEVETEFSPVCENQSFFSDVDKYLRDLGFFLFDLSFLRAKRKKYPEVYSKGQVLVGEALYFKSPLDKKVSSGFLNFKKAIKTIAIAEIYGYSDFSLELLDFYNSKKIIDNKNYKEIKKFLTKKTIKNIFSFEYQLFDINRHLIGGYLSQRMTFFHRLITKIRNKFTPNF